MMKTWGVDGAFLQRAFFLRGVRWLKNFFSPRFSLFVGLLSSPLGVRIALVLFSGMHRGSSEIEGGALLIRILFGFLAVLFIFFFALLLLDSEYSLSLRLLLHLFLSLFSLFSLSSCCVLNCLTSTAIHCNCLHAPASLRCGEYWLSVEGDVF